MGCGASKAAVVKEAREGRSVDGQGPSAGDDAGVDKAVVSDARDGGREDGRTQASETKTAKADAGDSDDSSDDEGLGEEDGASAKDEAAVDRNDESLTASNRARLERVLAGANASIASTDNHNTLRASSSHGLRSHPLQEHAHATPPPSAGAPSRPNTRHNRLQPLDSTPPTPPKPAAEIPARPSPARPQLAQVSSGVTRGATLAALRGEAPPPAKPPVSEPELTPRTSASLTRPNSHGLRPATRNTTPVSVQLLTSVIEGGGFDHHGQTNPPADNKAVPLLPSVAERQRELARAQLVVQHARYLEMDVVGDSDLLWIAEQSLSAPTPEGWEQYTLPDGETPYYFNVATRQTQWSHPLEAQFRALYRSMRAEKMARNAERAKVPNAASVARRAVGGMEDEEVGARRRALDSAGTDSTMEESTFSDMGTSLGTTRTHNFEESFGSTLTGSLNVSSYRGGSSRGLSLNMQKSFSKEARQASMRRGQGAPAFLPKWLRADKGALAGDDVRSS